MRILVSGGAGFIGSHLCQRLLDEGYQVICVDNLSTGSIENIKPFFVNKNFIFINYDVNYPLKELPKIDAIFHLASPASPNEESCISYHRLALETISVNTIGTLELLKLAKKNKAKFLFASSSEVYGDPTVHPQKETYFGNVNPIGPRAVYDEAKRLGETLVSHFWRKEGVNGRIARIFNTYGPRLRIEDKRMIVNFIVAALTNKPITIYGEGEQTRSLCYIDDLIEGLLRFMFYPKTENQVINLGSDEEHPVLFYAQKIKKLTSSKSKIVFSQKLSEGDPVRRRPDISKAKKILKWKPTTTLDEGLKKVIAYYKKVLKI